MNNVPILLIEYSPPRDPSRGRYKIFFVNSMGYGAFFDYEGDAEVDVFCSNLGCFGRHEADEKHFNSWFRRADESVSPGGDAYNLVVEEDLDGSF